MNTLEDILNEWSVDSAIDPTQISYEAIKTAKLHSKYLTALTKHKLSAERAKHKLNKLKRVKWDYYQGRLSQEELKENGWEPFGFLLKADIQIYMDSDDDIIKASLTRVGYDEMVKVLEEIIKEIKNRNYEIKNHIDNERFLNAA